MLGLGLAKPSSSIAPYCRESSLYRLGLVLALSTPLSLAHHSDKFKQKIVTVCSIGRSRDLAFANEDFQKRATAGSRVAIWPVKAFRRRHGPDGCRLVCDGNSAAMPPIAAAPEFGCIATAKIYTI